MWLERVLSSLKYILSGHSAEALRPAFSQLKKEKFFTGDSEFSEQAELSLQVFPDA